MSTATSWASWAVGAIGAKFYKSATPPPGSSQQAQGQSIQQVPPKDGLPTSTAAAPTSNPKRTEKSNDPATTGRGEYNC